MFSFFSVLIILVILLIIIIALVAAAFVYYKKKDRYALISLLIFYYSEFNNSYQPKFFTEENPSLQFMPSKSTDSLSFSFHVLNYHEACLVYLNVLFLLVTRRAHLFAVIISTGYFLACVLAAS